MKHPLVRFCCGLAIVVISLLISVTISANSKVASTFKVEASAPAPTQPFDTAIATAASRPRFWDEALGSEAILSANGRSMAIPGPDDEIRLIVQLDDEPLAIYINRMFASTKHLSADDLTTVRRHADRLAAAHRQLLADINRLGLEIKINQEFSYLINGLALSVKRRDWPAVKALPHVSLPDTFLSDG